MRKTLILLCLSFFLALTVHSQITFDFSTAKRGPVIGPLHYGIFYEEINHAGDGGIYAELVRNGSMEINGNNPDYWWTLGNATFSISSNNLINSAQKHSMHLNLSKNGDGVRNIGYWGINIVKGEKYKASFWLRTADNWKGNITLALEDYDGNDMGHAVIPVENASKWQKYTAEIIATGSEGQGWFSIRGSRAGTVYLDCVSLMPPTFKGRENGMRRDLAEKLDALHPRFMRFPGGCYIEGGIRYQWRHTVGAVEERLGIYNSHWGYPVSNGMGFHEFLQLAEDLGSEPLFVVNVGLGHGWMQDYQHIEDYIQEALDALEYANGDASTFWGAKRAAAGHPEPFNLRLIEIGNENYNFYADNNKDQSDHYAERFKKFYDAIKAKWPEVVCIGNVESWGTDNPTWRNRYAVDVVDEHYYRNPDWFAANYNKYNSYSRSSHKIYVGEYAVTSDFGTNGTLKAALGEAIYMAGMERNSDVCIMASYAPIFMNENEAQWRPDMLHYNSHSSFGTPSYWAQQMMASAVGHQNITWTDSGNSLSLAQGAELGLGSWNTDVTYSNIEVKNADGVTIYENSGSVKSGSDIQGIARFINVATDDCTIEMDAVKNSGDEGFLISFAYADGNNYAWWNLGGWSNSRHAVEQAVNGTKTTITTTDGSIQTGTIYHIKVVRSGMNVMCYLDDELIHEARLSEECGQNLFLCAALNEAEDSAIVKIINYNGADVPAVVRFTDAAICGPARVRVMSNSDNYAENSMDNPLNVSPRELQLAPSEAKNAKLQQGFRREAENTSAQLSYDVPAYSLSVITIPLADVSAGETTEPETLPEPTVSYSFDNGNTADDSGEFTGWLRSGASIFEMTDGNKALYTGGKPSDATDCSQAYFELGNKAANKLGALINSDAYSASINILLPGGGNLDKFCWSWNVNNGSDNYAGLINRANNLDWYYEKLASTSSMVRSLSGLCQGAWHNITVTSDNDETAIYVDGQLRAKNAATRTSPIRLNNTTKAWIGRSPFSSDARMTETFFDDFEFFDCVLTPAQVLTLYNNAKVKAAGCDALLPVADTETNTEAAELIGGNKEADITAILKNPDFANGKEGWEGTPFSAAPGTVAEHFSQIFDTYQILHNMPAGEYILEWQGFYRNGNIRNAYLRHNDGEESLAEVYVQTQTATAAGQTSVQMYSLFDSAQGYTYDPYTFPDNVATAAEAFGAGRYRQQMEFTLDETSDLRIGIRNFRPSVYDWACVDNLKLKYSRNNENSIAYPEEENITSANRPSGIYDLCGRRLSAGNSSSLNKSLPKGIYIIGGRKFVK
ncbi:MAG: hypothetical protein K6F94_01250 [Bacteroidaceae bacterium]|nr:hypothetical protein [Bacteroidaceae bacterium]